MPFFDAKISLSNWFKRGRVDSETAEFGRNARSDWQVVCFAFLLLNFISIAVSVFMYLKINKGEIFLADKRESPSLGTIDRSLLQKTVAFFEDKKASFETFKQQSLPTVDPFVPDLVPKR